MKQGFQDGYLTNKPTQTPGRLMSSTSDKLPSHNAGWERKNKPPNPHVVARGTEFNPVPQADEVSFGFVLSPLTSVHRGSIHGLSKPPGRAPN